VASGVVVTYDIHHKQISQEFQFIGTGNELRWVGGLFFMNERGSQIDNTYSASHFRMRPGGQPSAWVARHR